VSGFHIVRQPELKLH